MIKRVTFHLKKIIRAMVTDSDNNSRVSVPAMATLEPYLSRNEKLLLNCEKSARGLEIGPSYNPVAPKKAGYNVEILDHADASTLRGKYKNHNVDISRIEEVDHVWRGEPLCELTKKVAHYDWIIASHVIEHTPDLVSFLVQCELMLKRGGILSLAIPDHRYCFDIFRPISTSGEIVQAYIEKRHKHSPAAIFDHFSMGVKKQGGLAWDKNSPGNYELIHNTVEHAQTMLNKSLNSDDYIDIHNWRFTPSSFKLILADICALGYVNFSIKTFFQTAGFEFFCQLEKNVDSPSQRHISDDRLNLLLSIVEEHQVT